MATKLLNIDKDDSIENVIELITSSQTDTFMLLVPRGHKAFKDPEEINFLKEKSIELGKNIKVVTSDKEILANLVSFEIPYIEDKPLKNRRAPIQELEYPTGVLTSAPKRKKSLKSPLAIQEITFKPKPHEIEVKSGREIEREVEIRKFMSEKEPEEKIKIKKRYPPKLSSKKIFIPILLVMFLLLFFGASSALSKTKVTIKPQRLPLDLNISVTAKEGLLGVNSQDNAIPGEIIVVEKEASGTFDSTGEKELNEKAKGKITVYNKFSSAPQTLVATTRFESSTRHIFRTPKTITVPGAKIENGQTTPGSIEIDVMADKPGSEYNIEPSDFTVPGLRGSPKYNGFYAKSFSKITGGAVGKTRYVSEEDFNKAKKSLEEKLNSQLEEIKESEDKKILPDSQVSDIFLTPDSSQVNDPVQTFKLSLKAKISTLAFNEKDLKNLVQYYYNDKIKNQTPIFDSLNISYSNIVFKPEGKKLTFNARIKGQSAYKIDEKKIAKDISGKKTGQVQAYFKGRDEIESAKVVITPFWSSKIPQKADKIEVKIEY